MQAEPGKSTKGTFLGEDAEKSAFQGSWQLFSMVCEPSLIMNYIFDIQFVSYSAYLVPFALALRRLWICLEQNLETHLFIKEDGDHNLNSGRAIEQPFQPQTVAWSFRFFLFFFFTQFDMSTERVGQSAASKFNGQCVYLAGVNFSSFFGSCKMF